MPRMREPTEFKNCARSLKALADPLRLKLVQCLQTGPKSVGELVNLLGEELANVSHHLKVLRHARLVLDEKQGKYVIYSLNPEIYPPKKNKQAADAIDLGCCRLELKD